MQAQSTGNAEKQTAGGRAAADRVPEEAQADLPVADTAFQRLISGHYGLALTYWILFLTGAATFFIFGSMTVAERAWPRFIAMLLASIAYSFILLVGIQRAYRGNDPGKALARIAMLFLLLNLSNTLAVLSFIW